MSDTLASLCADIPSRIAHDTWLAGLSDRVRAAVLERHRVAVTEYVRLRVDLSKWRAWFESCPDWSLYIGADHLGRSVALAYNGHAGASVRLRLDLNARRSQGDILQSILGPDEDSQARRPGDSLALFPAEATILAAPDYALSLAARFRAMFDAPGSTIHWLHGEHGETIELPLRNDLRPLPAMYPFLDRPLPDYYDAYARSDASILLLLGPPGTGKTSFIRGFLQHAGHDAMVSYDPALLATDRPLTEFLTSEADVFVLEDADAMLRSRDSGNTLMHRLLSVGDGLVTLAGKKLIFSTNLESPADVDPALLRPGRCFDVLPFRLLDHAEACALARAAHVAEPTDTSRRYSAAEVFHAGDGAAAPDRRLRRTVGFV